MAVHSAFHGVGGWCFQILRTTKPGIHVHPKKSWKTTFLLKWSLFREHAKSRGGGALSLQQGFPMLSYLFSPQTTRSLVLRDKL